MRKVGTQDEAAGSGGLIGALIMSKSHMRWAPNSGSQKLIQMVHSSTGVQLFETRYRAGYFYHV